MDKYKTINGESKIYGIIGNPVCHSKSPQIHNTLSYRLGNNAVYVPFPVKEGELEAAVKGAYCCGIQGMNVTIPYKSEVMQYLDGIDDIAAKIGAVNTLHRTDKGYRGYNTDMKGLCLALEAEGITLEQEEVILLGAGGAARSAAFLCGEKGVNRVYLLNRTKEKGELLAGQVNKIYQRDFIIPMLLTDYKEIPDKKFLAIQATDVGLHPNAEHAVIEDVLFYNKIHTGYDLIYTPWETKFMSYIRSGGGKAYNGMKMLLYQAVLSYEIWNGVRVPKEEVDRIYVQLKTISDIEVRNC